MNFDFNDHEKAFFEKISTCIQDLTDPDYRTFSDISKYQELIKNYLKQLATIGYFKLGIQPDNTLNGLITWMAASEIIAQKMQSFFLSMEISSRLFGKLIATYGSDEQKSTFLPQIEKGQLINSIAFSENNVNILNNPISTKAIVMNNGDTYSISGIKPHALNAPIADLIAVSAMLNDQLAVFLIPTESEGLTINNQGTILAYHGVLHGSIHLDNCIVPQSSLIGPFDSNQLLKDSKLWENLILIASSIGMMSASFNQAKEHANTHHSSGKPIIAYQEISFKLAEMLTLLQTSKLLALRACWMAETKERDAQVVNQCAKVFCAESAETVASEALKIMSDKGLFTHTLADTSYQNAKLCQIGGISTEISRMMIAESLLG